MRIFRGKMLLAPVLAVTLALMLVGATYSFPPTPQENSLSAGEMPTPEPTQPPTPSPTMLPPMPAPTSVRTSSSQLTSTLPTNKPVSTPSAEPMPTDSGASYYVPSPEAAATENVASIEPLIFVLGAVAVAVIAVVTLFPEKNRRKEP
ncbi:MAG: hypothetical protein NWF05_00750 [Candidatus Bathyarchaeota archaeon]|nr:hypothetical protein [Candidatus Bathyarchaeota archaeon]